MEEQAPADYSQFTALDIRVGTILKAEIFEKTRNPAYKLWIDFGELGTKKSSAQITDLYASQDLIGKQVIAIVNFPKKQIADFMSECLVLGSVNQKKEVTLLTIDQQATNGEQIASTVFTLNRQRPVWTDIHDKYTVLEDNFLREFWLYLVRLHAFP